MTVMVGVAMQPFAAQFAIVAAADEGGVLARDRRLIDIAVKRPSPYLALVELTFVKHVVKRVQIVIALRADRAERSFQALRIQWLRRHVLVHGVTSIPSKAMSQPAAFTFASSGDPSMRIGLELLMWIRIRRIWA